MLYVCCIVNNGLCLPLNKLFFIQRMKPVSGHLGIFFNNLEHFHANSQIAKIIYLFNSL